MDLAVVANAERTFPPQWIAPNRVDVTDGFLRWATPLIGDSLPSLARFEEKLAPGQGLGDYVPQGLR